MGLVGDYLDKTDGGAALGVQLRIWAVEYKKSDFTSGFEPELYIRNQRGEMYKHILAFAGLTLVAAFGGIGEKAAANAAIRKALEYDAAQQATGRKESITEVKDDYAGISMGELLVKRFRNQLTDAQLGNQLRWLLCEKKK